MIIKKYLEQLSSLGNGESKKYYQWQLSSLSKCSIESINDKKLQSIRTDLDNVRISQNECYKNALHACLENKRVRYVEGYVIVHGVPIEHAWNSYDNVHFDLTQEILKHPCVDHFSIFELTQKQVISFSLQSELTGPYSYFVFREEEEKEAIVKEIFS